MIFALSREPHEARHRVQHRLEGGTILYWELLGAAPADALVAAEVELDPRGEWLARLDRVDFPPGSVAYRHTHPGPGIRYLLSGELTLETPEGTRTVGPGEAWFEAEEYPVLARASATEETAFVRVLLLPSEWAGRRTIRYLDRADDEKPKLQRPSVLREEPLEL